MGSSAGNIKQVVTNPLVKALKFQAVSQSPSRRGETSRADNRYRDDFRAVRLGKARAQRAGVDRSYSTGAAFEGTAPAVVRIGNPVTSSRS